MSSESVVEVKSLEHINQIRQGDSVVLFSRGICAKAETDPLSRVPYSTIENCDAVGAFGYDLPVLKGHLNSIGEVAGFQLLALGGLVTVPPTWIYLHKPRASEPAAATLNIDSLETSVPTITMTPPTPEDAPTDSPPGGGDEVPSEPASLNRPGVKDDRDKPPVGMMFEYFPRALLEVARVAGFGAKKYTRGGWISVPDGEHRYDDALGRHLLKRHIEGPNDLESDLLHLAHAAWNALAVLELALRKE